ncbi:MAG TPA: hypothetical protein O0X35_02670 [Methanocorpusculum sp.]|nr:hypothetical protein [Methanocorpusculum sp.]HJK57031.1 hypothetical protein [Methanocorpusculum sp.]
MAGPYDLTLKMSNGKVVSGYIPASLAVDKYINCDTNGIASADSPTDFIVPANATVIDIHTNCPTGAFEVIAAGQKTGAIFDCAAHQVTSIGRPAPAIGLVAGRQYRLKIVKACAA